MKSLTAYLGKFGDRSQRLDRQNARSEHAAVAADKGSEEAYENSRKPALTLISFYTEDGYYEQKAIELRAQCAQLGIACDIQPITLTSEDDWASICRRKVGFWRDMLHKHQAPVMWVDVDAVLLKNFNALALGAFDIALFLRNFKYLPQFNPAMLTRNFHPGYILFQYTATTLQFLDDAVEIERTENGDFTDDFVLEETFRRSQAQPRLLLLSPSDILKPGEADNGKALFRHGDSGNVKEYKGKVRQHLPRALDTESQKLVVSEMIQSAAKLGQRDQVVFLLKYLVSLNSNDVASYVKLLDILRRTGDARAIAVELKYGLSQPALEPYALRFQLLQLLGAGKWGRADELMLKIEATGDKKVMAFAQSRRFRHELDRRAKAAGIPDETRVRLFWWEEPYPGNLGDIVNPYIIEKMTGIPPRFAPRGEGMCAIGSVIKFAKSGTQVWGSGSPHANDTLAADADYRSVRGPLTRDLILRNGGRCPEIYGDAAWFLPILYAPKVVKSHKTGLILHFTHEEAPLDIDPAIRQISIRRLGYNQIEEFLDEMLSCERIVSSSLHGVIIANAYGIPACLATVSDSRQQVHGDGIKFQDYYASIGVARPPVPFDLSALVNVSDASFPDAVFTPVGKRINLGALIDVAPFDTLPKVKKKAALFDSM